MQKPILNVNSEATQTDQEQTTKPTGQPVESLILEIVMELDRATIKHPNWPDDVIYQAAIVQEECGELMRAAVQLQLENGSEDAVKKEAIQTAAMCLRLLRNL